MQALKNKGDVIMESSTEKLTEALDLINEALKHWIIAARFIFTRAFNVQAPAHEIS